MIHQDCYNKYCAINYFNVHIETEINLFLKIILIELKYILI